MNDKCPIWGEPAEDLRLTIGDSQAFDSPRTSGKYVLTRTASSMLERDKKRFNHRFKARLTSWLVEQRELGIEYPKISTETLEETDSRRDLPVHERAERVLKAISNSSPYIGCEVWGRRTKAGMGFDGTLGVH